MKTPPVVATPQNTVTEVAHDDDWKMILGGLPVVENPVYIKKNLNRANKIGFSWYNSKRRYFMVIFRMNFGYKLPV